MGIILQSVAKWINAYLIFALQIVLIFIGVAFGFTSMIILLNTRVESLVMIAASLACYVLSYHLRSKNPDSFMKRDSRAIRNLEAEGGYILMSISFVVLGVCFVSALLGLNSPYQLVYDFTLSFSQQLFSYFIVAAVPVSIMFLPFILFLIGLWYGYLYLGLRENIPDNIFLDIVVLAIAMLVIVYTLYAMSSLGNGIPNKDNFIYNLNRYLMEIVATSPLTLKISEFVVGLPVLGFFHLLFIGDFYVLGKKTNGQNVTAQSVQ